MSQLHGTFCWNELNTRDPDGAAHHYASLMGWQIETAPMADGSNYHVAMRGDTPVAGIFDMRPHAFMNGMPDHWFSYIAHDDVDRAVTDFEAAGGAVRRPAFDVPGTGRIAIVVDPIGAVIGLMTPGTM
ncbi:VOC family protein [Aliishimia ponticola]|uniref:VOC family protein n=1 Tax=Aliishimia ponticola TaxID=2499833 RepID=A0A4S4NEP6_9RHOB|nr:VOC family protein [Aliishimia ponticola]THH37245.1 VOC family protein [Aliishimia ponticola]